jgi:hypothetical protein
MKILIFSTLLLLTFSCSLTDSVNSDFVVCIYGTDYAEIEIYKQYGDSSLVTTGVYDCNEVQSLHFTNIKSGKYLITAVCNYPSLKENKLSKSVTYDGLITSYLLSFEYK